MDNRALDVKEAAAFLNVSPTTIYAQARAGSIPAHRIGAAWRFFEHELRAGTVYDPWARNSLSMAAMKRRRPRA